jgi:hypothetical protein
MSRFSCHIYTVLLVQSAHHTACSLPKELSHRLVFNSFREVTEEHQTSRDKQPSHTPHMSPHTSHTKREASLIAITRHTSHLTQAHASHTTRHTSQLVLRASSVVRHGAVQRPEDPLSVRTRVCVELVRAEAWCIRRHYVRAVPVGELAEPSSKVLH